MRLAAYVDGVGLLGPGLLDWERGADVLSGRAAYAPSPTLLPAPALLPKTERRRCGRVVKLALAVALEAAARARMNPASLASVFASSGSDGDNCHELCQALSLSSREISPTRFANSVHNAAAGYWSIASGATLESSALCAYDASFGAGLLEALTQVVVDGLSVLLVTYDTEYPQPLRAKRPLSDAFGLAFVLTPERSATSMAGIEAGLTGDAADILDDPLLEGLRRGVPAARGLPLAQLLSRGRGGRTTLDYLGPLRLMVSVTPCV